MKKLISIFLSVLMLASTSGVAYAQHFCSGMEMASEITFGEKQLSCGEMDVEATGCSENDVVGEDNHCCKNHITKIKIDDSFAKASFDLKINKAFVATFVSVFILKEVAITSAQKFFFADYSPPPLEQDFNILYETFLI